MHKVKIYPNKDGKLETYGRKLLYAVCEATSRDKAAIYKTNNNKRKSTGEKPVNCYGERSGILVSSYDSAKQAEEKTGISASNISKCCQGKLKTVSGYVWKYN